MSNLLSGVSGGVNATSADNRPVAAEGDESFTFKDEITGEIFSTSTIKSIGAQLDGLDSSIAPTKVIAKGWDVLAEDWKMKREKQLMMIRVVEFFLLNGTSPRVVNHKVRIDDTRSFSLVALAGFLANNDATFRSFMRGQLKFASHVVSTVPGLSDKVSVKWGFPTDMSSWANDFSADLIPRTDKAFSFAHRNKDRRIDGYVDDSAEYDRETGPSPKQPSSVGGGLGRRY